MESASDNTLLMNDASAEPATQRVMVDGAIEPVKVSFGYRIGLLAVTATMIVLPLLYLGFVALFGYGIYYHASVNRSVFDWDLPGRLWFIKVFVYFAPIIIGLILLLFMIKPLLARRAEEDEPYSLEHGEAPLLFQLIGQVCRAINAPIPSRIDLDSSINAAASFRTGFGSFFGNDVMLTLGLPLVAGLTVQQLAGLLAHEFGHFAQGAAMRLTYVIRSINSWFARVVYERDAWDVWLIETSEEVDLRVGWIFYLARLGVWLSRRVLWVTMIIGHGISSFMLRQMEYDADRHELRIAGTQAFMATNRQINHLNVASDALRKDMRAMFKERKLFDNTAELVVRYAREVPADVQARLHASWQSDKTRWYDSHPCYRDRNAHALAAAEAGCVHDQSPATTLFTDFSRLSRKMTLTQYRNQFGCDVPPEFLIPVQSASAVVEHDYAPDQQTVKNYFKGVVTSLRPVRLPATREFSFRNAETLMTEVRDARAATDRLFPGAHSAYLNFKDADAREFFGKQALTLIEAGIEFDPAEFGLLDASYEGVTSAVSAAEDAKTQAGALLGEFDQVIVRRMTASLQLLRIGPLKSKIENPSALQDESEELLWFLGQLSTFFDRALSLRINCARLESLLRYREQWSGVESFASTSKSLSDEISRDVEAIQKSTAGTRLPFAEGSRFVGAFLKNKDYCPDPLDLLLRDGTSHFEKTILIYYRALARLVTIASRVEEALPATDKTAPASA